MPTIKSRNKRVAIISCKKYLNPTGETVSNSTLFFISKVKLWNRKVQERFKGKQSKYSSFYRQPTEKTLVVVHHCLATPKGMLPQGVMYSWGMVDRTGLSWSSKECPSHYSQCQSNLYTTRIFSFLHHTNCR